MKKAKVKVIAAVLVVSILCAGTVTAQAGGKYCTLSGKSVGAETYANNTTYVAMARTVSSSYEVSTGVWAYCDYYNSFQNKNLTYSLEDYGWYGSEVTFTPPVGSDTVTAVVADHWAQYDGQEWMCTTSAHFN